MTEHTTNNQLFIRKLTEITLANLGNEDFGVKDLAREAGMSLYNVSRRLKAATNKTVSQFIRETRLRKALEMLQDEGVTASEVAYKVGFGSATYFNTCFHEFFGYPPGEVKKGVIIVNEAMGPVKDMTGKASKISLRRTVVLAFAGTILIALCAFLAYYIFLKTTDVTKKGDKHSGQIKSIAVLPFRNLSDSTNNQYFIDGLMDMILTNLSRIHALRVISRTSVDQYRVTAKSTKEIAKELNVDYIVEGSGQKYGNRFRLSVQLIQTSTDGHIWAKSYDHEIVETRDIFYIQSLVALLIAEELEAKITPEEKQLIEKASTTNLTALDFYQRGRSELEKFWADEENLLPLRIAEDMFQKALQNDSSFALAYIGLAYVYRGKHYQEYLSKSYIDSVPVLCDIALSYDNKLSEAYSIKGDYHANNGNAEQAMNDYDQAIKYNPNDWMAYWGKGSLYANKDEGYVPIIDNFQKAISLHPGSRLSDMLATLSYPYLSAGFIDEGRKYFQESFKLDDDSSGYYYTLSEIETLTENYNKAIEYLDKAYEIDSTGIAVLLVLASNYLTMNRYPEALKYIRKCLKINTAESTFFLSFYNYLIGSVFWHNGFKAEAESYFKKQIDNSNKLVELGRLTREQQDKDLDLACMYLITGEKAKTYKILEAFNQKKVMSLYDVEYFTNDPVFDSIRNEPQFRKILEDVESKYKAEHERVRKWLEEQKKL